MQLPKLPKFKNSKGFTLIELLVVVSVIGVLSGVLISLINTEGFRGKARDSQRIADLKQIQTALELYFADYRAYPVAASWINVNGSTDALSNALSPASGTSYINIVPSDPISNVANTGPCSDPTGYRYNYRSPDGTFYMLTAIMEIDSSNDANACDSLKYWGSYGCSTYSTDDVCYGVQNP